MFRNKLEANRVRNDGKSRRRFYVSCNSILLRCKLQRDIVTRNLFCNCNVFRNVVALQFAGNVTLCAMALRYLFPFRIGPGLAILKFESCACPVGNTGRDPYSPVSNFHNFIVVSWARMPLFCNLPAQ